MRWSLKHGYIWLRRLDRTLCRFLVTQGVCVLEKYDELSELVAFGQKLSHFTDQNGQKKGGVGPDENEF